MAFEVIMAEVDQLNLAGDRIEGLADHHAHATVSEALLTIAGNVRSSATVLALLVETKLRGRGGQGSTLPEEPV